MATKRRHIPNHIRKEVMERDGYACVSCGATTDLTLDHLIPYSYGGPDTVENLRVLCKKENDSRQNKMLDLNRQTWVRPGVWSAEELTR